MLRITVASHSHGTMLTLEGRLAGPWVQELADCWERRPLRDDGLVRVQLEAVTFIDAGGKALLRRMHREGAVLEASGCMTRAIVQDIVEHIMAEDTETPREKS